MGDKALYNSTIKGEVKYMNTISYDAYAVTDFTKHIHFLEYFRVNSE